MKKIALAFCMLSMAMFSFAQEKPEVKLDKSKIQLNAGIGLSGWGIPLYIGADYWVRDDITVGLEASFRYSLWHSYAVIGGVVNGNYHFTKLFDLPDNMDVYAGVSAGPFLSLGGYWAHPYFGVAGQIGGRYKIQDNLWVNAEIDGGNLYGLKVGITIRK
jgi:outer membrane immunogenic protein